MDSGNYGNERRLRYTRASAAATIRQARGESI
jgi:hypothetical protein